MNKHIISIEGNIGAGKSTFINILNTYLTDSQIVPEPVELWKNILDTDGSNILQKYYNDISRWAYTFQNLAYISRMTKIEDTIRTSNSKFILLDRSLSTDKYVFEKMLYDTKNISEIEHQIYNLWYDFYYKYVRPEFHSTIIYLRCDPQIALTRIKKRGRIEEQHIDIKYLNDLHNYHEKWLLETPNQNVIIVDSNKDFEFDLINQSYIMKTLVEKINKINICK